MALCGWLGIMFSLAWCPLISFWNIALYIKMILGKREWLKASSHLLLHCRQ
jgi:hypothetical protein